MTKPKIFVSHVHEERAIASLLKEFIEARFLKTVTVFSSSHEQSLSLGDEWLSAIKSSLMSSSMMLLLCSPLSISRNWVNFEAGAGWARGVPVVPLCHSGLSPSELPVPLSQFQGGTLSNEDDLKKLFLRISGIVSCDQPSLNAAAFLDAVKQYELSAEHNIVVRDTRFIHSLLLQDISLLVYNIHSSVMTHEELSKPDALRWKGRDQRISFNKIGALFEISLLGVTLNKKVYQRLFESINELNSSIKFVLSNSHLFIEGRLKALLEQALFGAKPTARWYEYISMIDQPGNKGIKDIHTKMIQEEPEPPTRRPMTNAVNFMIDYYETLLFYRDWLVQYEDLMDQLIYRKAKGN